MPSEPTPDGADLRRRRLRRLTVAATLALFAYTVVGFLVTPLLVRKIGEAQAEKYLLADVTIGRAACQRW